MQSHEDILLPCYALKYFCLFLSHVKYYLQFIFVYCIKYISQIVFFFQFGYLIFPALFTKKSTLSPLLHILPLSQVTCPDMHGSVGGGLSVLSIYLFSVLIPIPPHCLVRAYQAVLNLKSSKQVLPLSILTILSH